MLKKLSFIALLGCLFSSAVSADEYVVAQKNKAFSETNLKIKAGDTVHFKNSDPFFHNVFSLSDIQFFDLGSYPQGESKSVTFEKQGIIEVECAIHPDMKMTIEVK
jgi:plastocyanin